MTKTLLHQLFGLGKVPKRYAATLRKQGIVLIDEGIGGSVTYKQFKAPGRRHSWKKSWFTGSLVLTKQTFAAFAMLRPLIYLPIEDGRLSALRCSVEEDVTLLVTYDASLINDKWSGTVECRFRTAKAQLFLEHLAKAAGHAAGGGLIDVTHPLHRTNR
jgi:hypothetical protein